MNRSYRTFLVILLVVIVAVGFYRGWFTLSSHHPNDVSNKVNITLDIDGDKAKADAAKLRDMTEQYSEKAAEKVKEISEHGTRNKDQSK